MGIKTGDFPVLPRLGPIMQILISSSDNDGNGQQAPLDEETPENTKKNISAPSPLLFSHQLDFSREGQTHVTLW